MMLAIAEPRPIDVKVTGRCRWCDVRVVYLRGQHTIKAYALTSTNGRVSGMCLVIGADGKPVRHRCGS